MSRDYLFVGRKKNVFSTRFLTFPALQFVGYFAQVRSFDDSHESAQYVHFTPCNQSETASKDDAIHET